MENTPSLRLLFVINPISGGKEKTDMEMAIRSFFKPLLHTVDFFILSGKNDATDVSKQIEAVKPHKVIAVGGDGTVGMIAKLLLGTDIEMCIIPAGSANGMAKELDIPLAINSALDVVLNGQIKRADVIQINDEICLHLSDIGLNAKLIKYFEEGSVRGKIGYAKVAFRVLWEKQDIEVVIDQPTQQIKRKACMVALANASKYGTGAVINPGGNLYDGLFEVVIIRRLAISELLKMWLKPQPFDPKKIEVIQAKSVQMSTNHPIHFQVDGEYLGKIKKINAKIKPAALLLCLPQNTATSN